jgi:hypothetical protein
MNVVISRLGIYHAIKFCATGEGEGRGESEKEALISRQEGGRKYRPTSDRSHSDMAHMSVSSLASFIVAVSTAKLFEMSVND